MDENSLAGQNIAILVANGFEEIEMTEPQRALIAAGATVKIVSAEQALVNGWHGDGWGHYFPVDVPLSNALAADFDALLVPGGRRSIEKMAGLPHAHRIIKGFLDAEKPVALLSEAPTLLIAADRASGRTVAVSQDLGPLLTQAGATVSDEPMTVDGRLLTVSADASDGAARNAVIKLFTGNAADLAAAA